MADPYWRYAVPGAVPLPVPVAVPERVDAVPRPSFPGYASTDTSFLSTAHHLRPTSADIIPTDMLPMRPRPYGSDPVPGLAGLTPGVPTIKGFPNPLEDPSQRSVDGDESSILFVDGLPGDCTRREVAHLFRPFIGFKEIRLVHKEPRHSRDKAMILCFVEFSDAKCALTAMEALQSYKFDDKKPEAPSLKIQFAHFPFRPPAMRGDDQRR